MFRTRDYFVTEDGVTPLGMFRGLLYRIRSRILHRFNFHHTVIIGPLYPDGGYVERCNWCGISRKFFDPPRIPHA